MRTQHEPAAAQAAPPRLRDLLFPFTDRAYRKMLAYRGAWGTATGLTASASAVFVLEKLGLGFSGVAGYAATATALRVMTTPRWGRLLDRVGCRAVLVACTLGAAASSLSWVVATAGSAWIIGIDALACGLLLGGQELAVFALPLAATTAPRRPHFAAASVMVGGVAHGLATLVGGALAHVVTLRTLLALGVVLRIGAAVLAMAVEKPRSQRATALRSRA